MFLNNFNSRSTSKGSNRTLKKSGEPSQMFIEYGPLHTPYCVFTLCPQLGFTLLKNEPSTNMSHKGFCDPSSISCGHHDTLLSLDHRRFVEALTLSMLLCSLDTLLNGVIPISCLGQSWTSSGIFTLCLSI